VDETMGKPSSQTNRTIAIAIVAIVFVFVVFTVVLWRAHFFTFTGADSSEKVVAEALTFVGGLVGAIVSILGILLKYSIDSQAEERARIDSDRSDASKKNEEKRLQMDSDRADASKKNEEKRLQMEAATKAVQLFGTNDGHEAAPIQRAGALLILASLGQHHLALSLANELLSSHSLDGRTACDLIGQALDQALLEQNQDLQIATVRLLSNQAANLVTSTGFVVPMSIANWDKRLCPYVREWAPIALGKVLMARPSSAWRLENVNVIIGALAIGWRGEPDVELKNEIGAVLACLLRAFPECLGYIYHPLGPIDTDQILSEVASLAPTHSAGIALVDRLSAWMRSEETVGQSNPEPIPPTRQQ
jgi:hypothetical protein